jgi:hypothetical protein
MSPTVHIILSSSSTTLQSGPDHDAAHVADGAHHLELLVDHHGELLCLLAVAEEGQQALGGRSFGGVAVGPADRVHHDGAAGHAYMRLGTGTDQGAVPGVHDERPVGATFTGQQPAEERQCVGLAEARDLAPEGPPDHEVGALAPADLVLDDPPDDPRVLLVGDVERAVIDPHVMGGQLREDLVERQLVRLVGDQHGQRGAVVAHVETALGDLPERHQGQRRPLAHRDVGEAVRLPHFADQHLDDVVVAARGASAQQREGRAVVGEEFLDEHVRCSFPLDQLGSTGISWEERPRRNGKGRPSGGLCDGVRAQSVGRRMSGPPPGLGRMREHAPHPSGGPAQTPRANEHASHLLSDWVNGPPDPVMLSS